MRNELTEKKILEALRQQEPMPPIKHELGGSYYWTCPWYACGNTVTRWKNYCDQCGQRIDWGEE